jgi:hypothetical protein
VCTCQSQESRSSYLSVSGTSEFRLIEDLKRFQPVTVAPSVYAGIARARERTQDTSAERLADILQALEEYAALNWVRDHGALFRLGLRVGFRVREIELETDGLR